MTKITQEVLDKVVAEIRSMSKHELEISLEKSKESGFAKTINELLEFEQYLIGDGKDGKF